MPLLRHALVLSGLLLLGLTLAACGGVGGGGGGQLLPVGDTLYVDAALGSDQNDGSPGQPFKTITHALGFAASGDIVQVEPGLYDAVHGESFPITVPTGVHLRGDESARGAGSTPTSVVGGAPASNNMISGFTSYAAVELHAGSTLSGFIVVNPLNVPMGNGIGVALNHPDASVRRCGIKDCASAGIGVWGAGLRVSIVDNYITLNPVGISVRNTPLVRVEQNLVRGNTIGVQTWRGIDLGGGSMGSVGNNRIAWNTDDDLFVINGTGITVSAQNNYWNHVGPTTYVGTTNPMNGLDLWIYNGADSVDTTGAKKAVTILIPS